MKNPDTSRLIGANPVVQLPYPRQRGVSLVELMVGITIGLLTITVAMSTLIVTRSVSGTVSEASQMQQTASYIFRTIGQQIRQAGSVKLNLAFSKDPSAVIDIGDTVAFERSFDKAQTITGFDAPAAGAMPKQYNLSLAYQNYTEKLYSATIPGNSASQLRDCLGNQPSSTLIQSGFTLAPANVTQPSRLTCAGSNGAVQPMADNVTDFQVRYLVQTNAASGTPTIQYLTAATVNANWPAVFGIEVCLEIVGKEKIDTVGSTYRNCSWKLGDAETPRNNQLRIVYRNTYQLRSQGSTS